jgi:DNA-binding MarR family transcriptional regulator
MVFVEISTTRKESIMNDRFETFTVLIAKISRNIRKIKNQAMAEYNLRSAHVSCLYFIYVSDNITATELCEKCEEDKATISRALDYLEKNGFITCESKGAKRYKSPLSLTEKGDVAGRKIAEKIDLVLDEIGAVLTEDERDEFYRKLAIISDSIDSLANNKAK